MRPSPSLSSSSSWTPSPSSSSSSTSRRPSLSSSSSAASTWPSPSESVSPKQNQLRLSFCLVTLSGALYVKTIVKVTSKVPLPHPAVTLEVKRRKERSRTRAFISCDLLWFLVMSPVISCDVEAGRWVQLAANLSFWPPADVKAGLCLQLASAYPSLLATCSPDQQLILSSFSPTKAREKLPMSS